MTDQLTAATATLAQLEAIASGIADKREHADAGRVARLFFLTVWAPIHRDALALQPGEHVRFHCGEGNSVRASRGWRTMIYVGPHPSQRDKAWLRETWSKDGDGGPAVEWHLVDRDPRDAGRGR